MYFKDSSTTRSSSVAADEKPSFRAALEVLSRNRVDFVVVGGVAAVLNGAPISTKDRAVLAILRRTHEVAPLRIELRTLRV